MEFWRFRECVMHSAATCATCTACTVKHHNGLQTLRNVSAMHCNVPQRTVVCLSVGLHFHIWHPGKTAEWIGTRLGILVGVWLCIGVLDFGGDRRRGMGSFGGAFGALHGCQWVV